jgi:hypothetical protein
VLVLSAGCATAQPVVSDGERQAFAKVIREAEAEGAASEPPDAVALLRDAKSDFDYAQRLPMNPVKARHMLATAQKEAQKALALARQRREDQRASLTKAHQEAALAIQAAHAAAVASP